MLLIELFLATTTLQGLFIGTYFSISISLEISSHMFIFNGLDLASAIVLDFCKRRRYEGVS